MLLCTTTLFPVHCTNQMAEYTHKYHAKHTGLTQMWQLCQKWFVLYYRTESEFWHLPGRFKYSPLSAVLLQAILSNRQFVLHQMNRIIISHVLLAAQDLTHFLVFPVLVAMFCTTLPKQSEIANLSLMYDQRFPVIFFFAKD